MDIFQLYQKFPYKPQTVVYGTGTFHPMPITTGYNACSAMDTRNLGRYEAFWEVVPPPSKTYNCRTYCLISKHTKVMLTASCHGNRVL